MAAKDRLFHLNHSYYGLHVPPLIRRAINNFSSGSVCLVLTSELYSETDYREYEEFLIVVRNEK